MSMRLKTSLLTILIVFVATAATFFSGLYFTNDSLKKTMTQDLAFAIGIADDLVGTQMKLMKTAAATVAGRLSSAKSDEELAKLMVEQFNDYENISALSIFDRNGIITSYSVPQHDHDISIHGKYMDMAYNGSAIVTTPFYCSTMGEFVINVYTPMGKGRILAATMPGMMFTDVLSKHRLWQSGDIFMVNEEGAFIGTTDKSVVLAMSKYITASQDISGANNDNNEVDNLIKTIISSSNGVESYQFEGKEFLCAYSAIEESLLGWRVVVTVPFSESPQAEAFRGHIYSAVFFLLSGTGAAFFLSKLTAGPFNKIEAQNKDLESLNQTISEQAAIIMEEHERIKLMLDATPLASRLWSRDFKLIECNEAAVKLFNLKNKQEYLDRYVELSPEYQPDGMPTREKVRMAVSEAFEKGEASQEWMYQMLDGTLIPAEIKLVRVPYGGSYVVAAYARDLREQKKMLSEIEHRDNLLNVAHRTSFILFDTSEDKNIDAMLTESMELLARSVGADQVYIAQNETISGALHFICRYAWRAAPDSDAILPGMRFPYGLNTDLDAQFLHGKCMNGPVKNMPEPIREFFASFEAVSILVIPIVVQEEFWGLLGFSDCKKERSFGEDEVTILRSMSLMMMAAIKRGVQAANLREAHKRARLLTNSTPLGFNLWDRDLNDIETNDTAVKLFGLKNHREYLERFLDLAPEFQPDGQTSRKGMLERIKETFDLGYSQFEWTHQKLDGAPIPAEVTLVRIPYEDDYVVAGYIRDLREHKKMLAEIEQRDKLLQTVNNAADILLRAEPDNFSATLYQCMGMMAGSIDADRMYLFKNHTESEKLFCSQLYEWAENTTPFQNDAIAVNVSYESAIPAIHEALLRGNCVHCFVRDLPPRDRQWLEAQKALAVLIIPVFIRNEFWGFVGFNKCHNERLSSENEESIMHSGSLLIANALLRNEYLLDIRETTTKLETALTDAEEANNAKSDFLANMSHEMRTPLNAIIGLSEIALDNETLDLDAKLNLEKIHNSGSTLLSIVNDILDISKIHAGKFVIFPNQYDVPSLVNDAILQNVLRIGSKPIQFNLDIDETMPAQLYGDELRIKQIINNLLSNAIKYTEKGMVELKLSFEREDDTVWLTVRVGDTGIGMKHEHLEHLFTDYSQFGYKASYRAGGTGLGLVITKNLAEMMDGDIFVESEYGKGSAFTVRLKQSYVSGVVIGAGIAESLKRFQYSTSKLGRDSRLNRIRLPYASVLVVDDNLTNLDVAKGLMKPYGMQVDCVSSGKAAVNAVREEKVKYNAIFMDHMMPEMNGLEAVKAIRHDIGSEYAKTIPIIALTANAIAGSEKMFLENGFQSFISKPIDMARLDDVIRRFVRDKDQEALLDEEQLHEPETSGENGGGQEISVLEGITIKGIDKLNALERFDGDENLFIGVLRSYAVNTKPLLGKLKEYLAEENFEDYTIAIHGAKGASYSIFALEAGKAAEALELAAKTGDFETVKIAHGAFDKIAEDLLDAIEKALAEVQAAAKEPNAQKHHESNAAGFTAQGAEVLFVDDNETSLTVALGLLEPLEMKMDTAPNGKIALQMIQKKQYHLIFMDHLMPVMDGIEATKKLRLLEGECYQNVPVIALSADQAAEAGEEFARAGMNDFIKKPFEMKEICAKIKRWLPAGFIHEKFPDDIKSGGQPEEQEAGLPAIEGIDSQEGLRYAGTKKLLLSLLGDFYKLIDMKSAKIEKYLADGLVRDVTIEVHALKSTARMIGAKDLSEDFARLEQYGNEENIEALESETPEVLKRYRKFKALLKPFGEMSEEGKKPASSEELVLLLKRLGSAMDKFDLDEADEALNRLEELRIPPQCRTQMENLRAYVADVAIEDVIKLAGTMIETIETGY